MSLPCGTFPTDYKQDNQIFGTRLQKYLLVALLVILFALPAFTGDVVIHFMSMLGVTLIAMLGLQILTGFCGQVSLGHAGYIAVGAYATATLLASYPSIPFLVILLCAAAIAGLAGLPFGAAALRVKGFYLALVTLGGQLLIMFVLSHLTVTGGARGLIVPAPSIMGIELNSRVSMFFLIMTVAVIMCFVAKNISRTRLGRALMAIRDNDIAANINGVNVFQYKLLVFFVSCFFAGLAGSLWAYYMGWVAPEHFTLRDSIWYLGFLFVGGIGTTTGAIFAAVFWRLLDEITLRIFPTLAALSGFLPVGFYEARMASIATIVFGLIIALFILFEPKGLAYRWGLFKTYYRLFPFARMR